jgi:23S rRNA (adenine2503-C2)-methyltransferase
MSAPTLLTDLTRERLAAYLAARGARRYHADHVFAWFYQKRAISFDPMTDLSKALRASLAGALSLALPEVQAVRESADGTKKLLFRLADGQHVESVLMPIDDHHTVCVSSQVGCRFGCRFCLTGERGFVRDLTAGEIVGQIVACDRLLPEGEKVTRVVFMGMGEPLDNYDAVTTAVRVLQDDFGMCLSSRRITVSTAGHVPGLTRLAAEKDLEVALAVSLNAADDATRSAIMPINRAWPMADLLAALRAFPLRPRQRITIEYVLLAGVNDSTKDADKLARALEGVRCMVNLIPRNAGGADGQGDRPPDDATVLAFQKRLHHHGYRAIIRTPRGADIEAACGQLRGLWERT